MSEDVGFDPELLHGADRQVFHPLGNYRHCQMELDSCCSHERFHVQLIANNKN